MLPSGPRAGALRESLPLGSSVAATGATASEPRRPRWARTQCDPLPMIHQ
jgi:hypothetical protein